jgi:hypothetical protein
MKLRVSTLEIDGNDFTSERIENPMVFHDNNIGFPETVRG